MLSAPDDSFSTFVREAWRYYAGSAPLIFCFIPMWVENGQIRVMESVVLAEAVLLAGAYLLRVCMAQAVRSSMKGLFRDRPARASGSRSRPTVELHVSVHQGVAFQMDHHPLEVALPNRRSGAR